MAITFAELDNLSDPIVRLDTLLAVLFDYVSHPADEADPEHVAFTLMMAREQLDEIKAGHNALFTAHKAVQGVHQVVGKAAAVKVA